MALSLTRAGSLNSKRVRTEAEALVAADATGNLQVFFDLARDSAFSTNVDASKVEAFDALGTILDARALKIHEAGGDEIAGLEAFQATQEDWFIRRTGFEALWRDGSRFVYGAVNAGGMGVERPRFGPFCLVVANPAAEAEAIAVFPADTAERYASPTGDVDRDLARNKAAAWRDRGHATVIERAADVPTAPTTDWPRLICNPRRYLEAIVAPGPELSAVDAIRVRDSYLERLADLTVAGSEDPLEAATEQRQLNAIETIRRWRSEHGVAIEAVG